MATSGYKLRIRVLSPCVFFLMLAFGATVFAQTTDTERTQNIRNQLLKQQAAPAISQDLEVMRNDTKNAMDALVSRIVELEKSIVDLKAKIRVLEARTTPPNNVMNAPVGNGKAARKTGKMQVSLCNTGCDASKFADAVIMLNDGGTLTVKPGVYFDCITIKKSMKLIGEIAPDGSRAHLRKIACRGKAAINLNAPDVEIHGLKISEIAVPSLNGACVRVGDAVKTLLIKDIICLDSENGLLGRANNLDGVITIENSTFEGHGKSGKAHGIYINGGAKAILRNVNILSINEGHVLKTGARETLVEDSVLAALQSRSGAAINAYGGGKLTVRNSVLQLGPNSENNNFLAYADEPQRTVTGGVHEILIEKSWIIYDDPARCCRWLFSQRSNILDEIVMRNNKFVGGITPNKETVTIANNKEFADRAAAGLKEYNGTLASLPRPGS